MPVVSSTPAAADLTTHLSEPNARCQRGPHTRKSTPSAIMSKAGANLVYLLDGGGLGIRTKTNDLSPDFNFSLKDGAGSRPLY
eukprot:2508256-Pyramimonas_sp.AAC.1